VQAHERASGDGCAGEVDEASEAAIEAKERLSLSCESPPHHGV